MKYSRTSMARTPRNYEKMFETGVVRVNKLISVNHSAMAEGIIGILFEFL